jgi:hypothetical protein
MKTFRKYRVLEIGKGSIFSSLKRFTVQGTNVYALHTLDIEVSRDFYTSSRLSGPAQLWPVG